VDRVDARNTSLADIVRDYISHSRYGNGRPRRGFPSQKPLCRFCIDPHVVDDVGR